MRAHSASAERGEESGSASSEPSEHRKGKILAIDFGTKRIGWAVSDPDQTMAFARDTFDAQPQEKALAQVEQIVKQEGIVEIVIGAPLSQENEETPMSLKAREFGSMVGEITGVGVFFIDESSSSDEALAKIPFRKDRADKYWKNAVAAQIILERYLER